MQSMRTPERRAHDSKMMAVDLFLLEQKLSVRRYRYHPAVIACAGSTRAPGVPPALDRVIARLRMLQSLATSSLAEEAPLRAPQGGAGRRSGARMGRNATGVVPGTQRGTQRPARSADDAEESARVLTGGRWETRGGVKAWRSGR